MTPTQDNVIELQAISKSYAAVRALDAVSFDLRRGEVHGILGENGAGKSTLIKIMGGVIRPDSGRLLVNGEPAEFHRPADARRAGICVIHQELEVHPELTVTENVLLGILPSRRGVVDWRRARAHAAEVLTSMGLDFPVSAKVKTLGLAERQLLAIARALAVRARVLIMDEPTAALTEQESSRLAGLVRRMSREGISVVYVSHRVSEVMELADRVSVLRDGRHVETVDPVGTTADDLISAMVGRELVDLFPRRSESVGDVALKLDELTGDGFRDISLTVREGETVALFGLLGSGCANLSRAIVGALPARSGSISVNGVAARMKHPADSRRLGLALLPGERRREGLVMPSSVTLNIVLSNLKSYERRGVVQSGKARVSAESWKARLSIRTPSTATKVEALSGGNQQKVIFARWLDAESRVLILEEPTRGVDVGAKAEIYRIIHELTQTGVAIVLVSSEIPEVMALSDRVVVMSRGVMKRELAHEEITKEMLLRYAAS
jgi:ABC-type sugar transport system ATPase subunit